MEGAGGVGVRRCPAASWLENGRKVAKSPPGMATLPMVIVAMKSVDGGLKILASVKESLIGDGWPCSLATGPEITETRGGSASCRW